MIWGREEEDEFEVPVKEKTHGAVSKDADVVGILSIHHVRQLHFNGQVPVPFLENVEIERK